MRLLMAYIFILFSFLIDESCSFCLCLAVLVFTAAHRLLVPGGVSCFGARALGRTSSVIVALRLSCLLACEIFLVQELNPCPLHCQADS